MILMRAYLPLKFKLYLIMTSFLTTPTSVKRKYVVGKFAKPRAVPTSAGSLLLLQPRATTAVTRSHCRSRNFYLWGKHKSLCLADSKNLNFSTTNHAIALSNLHPSCSQGSDSVRTYDSGTNLCSKIGFFGAELLWVSVTFTKGSTEVNAL